MWQSIAGWVLRLRIFFLVLLLVSTLLMAWFASKTHISHTYEKVVPPSNQVMKDYDRFYDLFGIDGNIMVMGFEAVDFFEKQLFNDWLLLGKEIEQIQGINRVISIPSAPILTKDREERKFISAPLAVELIESQETLDSLKKLFFDLPFYSGLLYSREKTATLMLISFNEKELDSNQRSIMIERIKGLAEQFGKKHRTEVHFSGLPFIRSYKVKIISRELVLFLIYSVCIIFLILMVLFRSFRGAIFPLIVVGISAVWSLGLMQVFGFRVNVLTGLIPTLLVVIGIPNCVYLMNTYHNEFRKHGNKVKALTRMIQRIGYVTFFANLTTAIGFGVFYFTSVTALQEFGIIAAVMISLTFLISLVSIPLMLSLMPEPKIRQTKHLESKFFSGVLRLFDHLSRNYRPVLYGVLIVLMGLGGWGVSKMRANGFILDDVPKNSKIYTDLKWVEKHFRGIMPFEILIDTGEEGGALKLANLKKTDDFEAALEADSVFSSTLSLNKALKFSRQAYYNNLPRYYTTPDLASATFSDRDFKKYLDNSAGDNSLSNSLSDSTKRILRISTQISDIGSENLSALNERVTSLLSSIFSGENFSFTLTGISVVAYEGFRFLVTGLLQSVAIAFLLIALIMAYLFRSFRMLMLSLIPNIIPLLLTAGIMGFLNIPLKPSTVLVFSITFGISVDYTIHFLAKYRQESLRHSWDIAKTVSVSIQETGTSMIYTSIILFFGFFTFTMSSFEGTQILGLLTSATLVVALFTNLLILPALLLSFDKLVNKKGKFALKQQQKFTRKTKT